MKRKTVQIIMTYRDTLIKTILRPRVELDLSTQFHHGDIIVYYYISMILLAKNMFINLIERNTIVINVRKTLKLLL